MVLNNYECQQHYYYEANDMRKINVRPGNGKRSRMFMVSILASTAAAATEVPLAAYVS